MGPVHYKLSFSPPEVGNIEPHFNLGMLYWLIDVVAPAVFAQISKARIFRAVSKMKGAFVHQSNLTVHIISHVYYSFNAILLSLLSYYGCNFHRAVSSIAGHESEKTSPKMKAWRLRPCQQHACTSLSQSRLARQLGKAFSFELHAGMLERK